MVEGENELLISCPATGASNYVVRLVEIWFCEGSTIEATKLNE